MNLLNKQIIHFKVELMNRKKSFETLPGSVSNTDTKIQSKKIRRILGIDPGLANTGFGVIDYYNGRYRMVSYGCVSTKAESPHGEVTAPPLRSLFTLQHIFNVSLRKFAHFGQTSYCIYTLVSAIIL